MHSTSYNTMRYLLHRVWLSEDRRPLRVLDVGSMVAEANQVSYKEIVEGMKDCVYVGLDMVPGKNVDVVAEDPYRFPAASNSYDVVISGQAFEHIEFPWLTIQEIARVLKAGGFAIIIAPSSGPEHRYPNDCWRFYPDGLRALGKWAKLDCIFTSTNWHETALFMWGDTVGIFYKPKGQTTPTLDLRDLRRYQMGSKLRERWVDIGLLLQTSYHRLGRSILAGHILRKPLRDQQ